MKSKFGLKLKFFIKIDILIKIEISIKKRTVYQKMVLQTFNLVHNDQHPKTNNVFRKHLRKKHFRNYFCITWPPGENKKNVDKKVYSGSILSCLLHSPWRLFFFCIVCKNILEGLAFWVYPLFLVNNFVEILFKINSITKKTEI